MNRDFPRCVGVFHDLHHGRGNAERAGQHRRREHEYGDDQADHAGAPAELCRVRRPTSIVPPAMAMPISPIA